MVSHLSSPVEDADIAQPLRIPNAAEMIAGHLRRQIVRGELEEGRSLPPEGKLLIQFGVSGPTLRAAYRILESEGLITVRRGSRGGARVHRPQITVASRYVGLLLQMDGTTLDDLFQARIILEPPLAGLVAANHTKAEVGELRERLDETEKAVDNAIQFAQATNRFHETIVRLAGNHTVKLLVSLLWNLFEQHTSGALAETGERPGERSKRRAALHAHQRLVDLIEAGDAEGAESFWRKHMTAVGELFAKTHGPKTVFELLG
ncbi:MAG: FadR/GntR family transcriptional regulator [Acidimicrobiales bacterium]